MAQSTLLDRIDHDLKEAMRRKDQTAKLALRSIKAAILQAQKSGKYSEALTEPELEQIIATTAKQRRDAVVEYERAGRSDLAANESAELAVIEQYLPRQLSPAEIEAIVREVIAETGAESIRDMKKVMPAAMQRMARRADGRVVNQTVRRLLG